MKFWITVSTEKGRRGEDMDGMRSSKEEIRDSEENMKRNTKEN